MHKSTVLLSTLMTCAATTVFAANPLQGEVEI